MILEREGTRERERQRGKEGEVKAGPDPPQALCRLTGSWLITSIISALGSRPQLIGQQPALSAFDKDLMRARTVRERAQEGIRHGSCRYAYLQAHDKHTALLRN